MKLSNIIIIFLALALPIVLVLSFYVSIQVDTASLREDYNSYLINATHETMVAFEWNTTKNEFSNVADSKIRDLEAAKNIFSSSLATSFGATGSTKSYMMSRVPALVFTLYDGYYMYTPTKSSSVDGTFSHELKPYVYYSKTYTDTLGKRVLTINFSLDNYVAVYFYDGDKKEYTSRAGYLEIIPSDKDGFLADLTGDARYYYTDAWGFTEWFNGIIRDNMPNDVRELLVVEDTISHKNSALPGAESRFNDERTEVIKSTITNNLIQAMEVYSRNTTGDFQMPKLTENEWENVLNNVCCIAFLQGMPVGTTTYNGYAVAVSSENKEVVTDDDLVFTGYDGSYHRIWCPNLTGSITRT